MLKSENKDLAPIGRLPQGNPVEAIGDFFQSLMEDNMVRKPPLWDSAGSTSCQLRERARVAAEAAQDKLARCREEQVGRRQQLDSKWESLRERQHKLRQSFIKFNKFICENQNKRERAADKMEQDSKALEVKSAEVEIVRKDLADMNAICKDMEDFLKDHTMYENYLLSVVAQKWYFRQPTDILNKFETITSAKKILSKRQERDLANIMAIHSDMGQLMEERILQMMGLNNTLAKLRLRYDDARNDCSKWELMLKRVIETTAEKQVELCRVRDSLWDFYCTICKQKGIEATADFDDYDTQLIYVYKGIKELRDIVINSQKKIAKDAASNVVQTPKKL